MYNKRKTQIKQAQKPFILFSRPGTHFIEGEKIAVSVFNPGGISLEIIVIKLDAQNGNSVITRVPFLENPVKITLGNVLGNIQIVAREIATDKNKVTVRSNSIMSSVLSNSSTNQAIVKSNRIAEHKQQCAVQQSSTGVLTLHDPWVIPGNSSFPTGGKWFPTPVWEGATSLYNETKEYYEDPFQYFLQSIEALQNKGFTFVTWHDMLDGEVDYSNNNILLQFDIDAGQHSFIRVAKALSGMGVRATAMVHWQARHWYIYDFLDADIDEYTGLQDKGWAFGYHNNTLTNLTAMSPEESFDKNIISKACEDVRKEITNMQTYLDVRTMTHHGGNVLNHTVPIPADANISCVDRNFAQSLWSQVNRAFSDGSFTSRPTNLKTFVDSASEKDTLLFMRCHPLKYGNYPDALDVAPLPIKCIARVDYSLPGKKKNGGEQLSTMEKQTVWLLNRKKTRRGEQLNYVSLDKPITTLLKEDHKTNKLISNMWGKRNFEQQNMFPWMGGNPRAFWWKCLSSFSRDGRVFCVGRGCQESSDEAKCFLNGELDSFELMGSDADCPSFNYETILFDGLHNFLNPDQAIVQASKHIAHNGCLLICGIASTHAELGGLFSPATSPIWSPPKEKQEVGCYLPTTTPWSFDQTSIEQFMLGWRGSWYFECVSHHWFIYALADSNL